MDADGATSRQARANRDEVPPAGFANHPAYSPDGRWLAAIGVLEAEPLDDVSPTILVGPADGSAAPWALAPDLDRPIGNWADTDLNGWMVSGRPGPYWLDPATIVATVTDRGRSHPVRFELDPDRRGRPRPAGPTYRATIPGRGQTRRATRSPLRQPGPSPCSARWARGRWS